MQKDFHYYMTFALAIKSGIDFGTAKLIAWANQFTDDCRDVDKYDIRTQCGVIDQWYSKEIQQFVLVPFHFLPGGEKPNPWIVIEDSDISRIICDEALDNKNPISIGMSLHSFQDTYSHQEFTGWQDNVNAKNKWTLSSILTPNIGHADFQYDPDIISKTWESNQGKMIVNENRFRHAAHHTYMILCSYSQNQINLSLIDEELEPFWQIADYESRKQWLLNWAGVNRRYKEIEPSIDSIKCFRNFARKQISIVMEYISQF